MKETTLCYIEKDGQYLMLHRIKKENDINHDKWIGVGGKFMEGESPFECARREIREETGLSVRLSYRGIVTFVQEGAPGEYMHLFLGYDPEGEPVECDEGELAWIDKQALYDLTLWEGDRIFLDLLRTPCPFFSLKLVYRSDGTLAAHTLEFAEG